ncbi:hypothetical protein LXL04_005719 [Taraxacum kok-saghyz]
MPPKNESASASFFSTDTSPTLEASIAAMVENISQLVSSSHAHQSATQSQLDIIMKQLTAQYEQNNTLLTTLLKPASKPSSSSSFPKTEFKFGPQETQPRPPKLALPTFNGSNPLDWLFQADQYFSFYHIEPPERLTMTAFYLTGDALSWYKYLYNNNLLTTWDSFTQALTTRFGPSSYDNHQAALFKLRQTSTVTTYQTEFEKLSNCITGLPPDALLNCFLSGLRSDICQELATRITIRAPKPAILPPYRPSPTTSTTPSTTPTTISSGSSSGLLPTPAKPTAHLPFTRLSPDAMQKRRAVGLCFRCPEKYHPGHKCNPPQFLMIVDHEDDLHVTDNATNEPNSPPLTYQSTEVIPFPPSSTDDTFPHFLSLSPAALLGTSSPRALRVTDVINGHYVTVLVNCGSTHNIVQPRVAKFFKLPTTPIPTFSVMIGNGTHIHSHGYCDTVPLQIASASFTIPLFVLPIEGADLVLGLQWLGSLGPITADFSVPTLIFQHHRQSITLTGEPAAVPASASTLHHLLQQHSIASMHALLFEPTAVVPPADPPTTDPHIQALLQEFEHIFATPNHLPPHRPHDHRIPLLPNTPPVNVKPYRYPHFQKQIMTDLITSMLQDGLIRPSTSPFFSPVLLVKKKDGTWRFCVDYRALNAITIRDHFPIPTVDELLDELHDALIFSKIDLRAGSPNPGPRS